MWSCTLFDALTGLLAEPIDVPSLKWEVSVSDSSLSTSKDKGTGEGELGSLELPWAAVPGSTPAARHRALAPMRRGLVLMWDGVPVAAGLVGDRTDRWLDTSFGLLSPMDVLAERYIVREGTFGKGTVAVKLDNDGNATGQEADEGEASRTISGVTTSTVRYDGLSYRAIACDLVRLATSAKPGGQLPIELPYLGESGRRSREYYGYNVRNNDCAKLLKELANVQSGPDIQFRPGLADETHVRWTLLAGSDAEPLFLGNSPTPTLTAFPGGGTAENVEVAHQGPTMRVYGTGSGTDRATLCHLAEDLALAQRRDPWPLVETAESDRDLDNSALLASHAAASLEALGHPVCQVQLDVDAADPANPVKPGLVWPGEPVDLWVQGHPALPDGTHSLRLMEMSGDLGNTVHLTFDVMADPLEDL